MAPASSPPNVLLVTVDCLRRDRVSAYGYERRTTPFLDALLDRARHASSAHAPSSWTCPSVCSFLTGLYPHHHGGGLVLGEPKNLSRSNLPTRLAADIPTLADRLAERGYATAAFGAVWNAHLPLPGRFDDMVMIEKPAPRLIRRSLTWIRERDQPFFLWLHLGDTHEPLDVPRDLWNVFGSVPRSRKVRTWDFTHAGDAVGSPAFERYREHRIRLYDAATRSVDRALEDLLTELERLGTGERTVVAVTADHGEEFWEHRGEEMAGFSDPRDVYGVGHGHHLFQVHLLVPLVFLGPGIEPGEVRENVSLVDLAPTILQAIGLDADGLDGRSLLEPVPGERPILAEAIAYGFEKRAVIEGDRKLLSAPGDGVERLYRLGPDRSEEAVEEDPAATARLRTMLPGEPAAVGEQTEATDEIVEHLRDLGYLE
jgi:arylsulfatase A-like enzyme